jgi:chemotaxis signal transduction protein
MHAMYVWQEKPMQDDWEFIEDSLETDESTAQQGDQQTHAGAEVPMEDILLIRMGERPFLVRAHDVTEIVRPMALTPVPMAPDHLLGLANIHGQIVCIIDPCTVLHLASDRHPLSAHTRYLILRHPRMHVGIWVEEVASIFRAPSSDVPAENADDQENLVRGSMSLEQGQFDMLNVQALFR